MFKKYNNNDRAWSGLFGLIVLVGILVYFKFHVAENTGEEYTLPHADWTPQDSLEDKEPDAIYYDTINDNMMDIDMDCGGNESIPTYSKFTDVPAGAEDKIIVDDILYKINNNKTKWIPVYPDEHVMWIGSNGDTIWE